MHPRTQITKTAQTRTNPTNPSQGAHKRVTFVWVCVGVVEVVKNSQKMRVWAFVIILWAFVGVCVNLWHFVGFV